MFVVVVSVSVACEQAGRFNPPQDHSLDRIKRAGKFTWGADVVGGVPYVFEDPKNPKTYIGFEVDIAKGVARRLGVEQELVIRAWDSLVPELQKQSFDMAMNGLEDLEDRGKIVLFSRPYYVYTQQLTVSKERNSIASLADLRGKTVGTLSGSAAEDILRATPGISVRTNPEIVYSYRDLEAHVVDAVLLDSPIAAAYGSTNPKLKNVGESFAEGRYIIAFRREDRALRDAVNAALDAMINSGELRQIYERWGLMDSHQAQIGVR
jgi:polar amino acid transport system substrate-binding protein